MRLHSLPTELQRAREALEVAVNELYNGRANPEETIEAIGDTFKRIDMYESHCAEPEFKRLCRNIKKANMKIILEMSPGFWPEVSLSVMLSVTFTRETIRDEILREDPGLAANWERLRQQNPLWAEIFG